MNSLLKYVLRISDTSLITGQRISEWCSKGPSLEEDIALSNIALDLFGLANGFLEYASKIDKNKTADDFAFKRNEREFFNFKLAEQPNGHFGNTIVKLFMLSAYNSIFYSELSKSNDETIAALSAKSLKEVKYHLKYSKSWMIRLGDGTNESNFKVQESLNSLWQFTGEFFESDEIDNEMNSNGTGIINTSIKERWNIIINNTLKDSKLIRPIDGYMQTGSKKGIHTEHLGHLLSEMQYLQRAYPDAKW